MESGLVSVWSGVTDSNRGLLMIRVRVDSMMMIR